VYLRWIICIVFFLTGCSSVPRPTGYPFSTEKKMQSPHHWDMLAKNVVKVFFPSPECGVPRPPTESVYVNDSDKSPFGRAFRTFLMSELENRAIRLSSNEDNSTNISWAVQLVEYESNRRYTTYLGPFTSAWAISWASFGIAQASDVAAAVVGSGLASLWLDVNSLPIPYVSRREVIITAYLARSGRIEERLTKIFYINDADHWQYWDQPDAYLVQGEPLIPVSYAVVNK